MVFTVTDNKLCYTIDDGHNLPKTEHVKNVTVEPIMFDGYVFKG